MDVTRGGTAPARRAITIEDLMAFQIANDPQLSPDGTHAVCPVTVVDAASNGYRTHLWVVPADGGAPWQLTAAPARDTSARWSPDGARVAFLSDRGGTKQLWVIEPGGGEARTLTSEKLNPTDPVWSPDGRWIAFVGKPEPAGAQEDTDVRVFTRLHYKFDGEGLWDGRWKQVFVVSADGGAARQVTRGDFDHLSPAWSPDGSALAYTGNPSPDVDLTGMTDVWVVAADGGEPRRVTDGRGQAQQPAWSPDGTQIAYLGHDQSYGSATHSRIWTVPAAGGVPTCLTAEYEGSIGHHIGGDVRANASAGGLTWTPDGSRLYFLTSERGNTEIASVSVPGGDVRLETRGEHDLAGCSLDRACRRVACIESDPLSLGEVAVGDLGGSAPHPLRRLTSWNAGLLDGLALSRPERFEFRGADGWPIEGWVMKPASAAAGARVPVVMEIHGGPHGAYGNTFMHVFQVLCAAGYGVVYSNPRGSTNYSQAFTAATHHDWGGGDYQDLILALDHALGANPWMDPDRQGVAGGSYGGYMVNWMVGHTQRFRAAVSQRSTCDRYMQWGISDLAAEHGKWEFPGNPWEAGEFYRERSPISYVPQMKTPILLIHSENDHRCPIVQTEMLYVALLKMGTPTMMVRFPNESHGMSSGGKPKHRVEQLRHIVGWFRKYLDEPGPARGA